MHALEPRKTIGTLTLSLNSHCQNLSDLSQPSRFKLRVPAGETLMGSDPDADGADGADGR